ncbi:hypothetical protein CDQ92_11020 [Sphingopyxis bauzanensis]|uniref:Uncharacterized protein n=2 Tax=Sphingopyxis bauzanensis TaxID=651663 RepID=A0A246JWV1_9SPHN|nr:hypothetical protein [Sphingopyxis bauzanensis]OWQ97535.1 hypothetical protein CDQ92_11020 [Sphingopyxis bauzanensis]
MDIDEIRQKVQKAIGPLKQAELDQPIYHQLFMSAKRTDAGGKLPPYYLVYFLLIDLLGFRNNGQWDKTAWSVTVDYEGTPFLVEHRKFGLGIFGMEKPKTEAIAERVATCLNKAAKAARPYFEWRASEAAKQSHLNVVNRSRALFARVEFYLGLFDARTSEAEARKGERIRTQTGPNTWSTRYPAQNLTREARWFALSAIESFFSWTEHVFIHIATLRGLCSTGEDVAALAKSDWADKYKAALDITHKDDKRFYDDLAVLRRQLRNFVAHGSFGKEGEALLFHSGAGAVPMLLPHNRNPSVFRFGSGLDFRTAPSIDLIKAFIAHLWTGVRSPAKIYLQDYELPVVLTRVKDGSYAAAMCSDADMEEFARHLAGLFDRHANMDF